MEQVQAPLSATDIRRILVVDDDHLTADSLATLLRMFGYDVHTRYDGASAVVAAEELRPHLIILDLGMPILNGYEACRKIRAQSWGEGFVIVAVTGWGPNSGMPSTEDCGFNAHVVKPVRPGELKQLLANLLQDAPES
jgi:CheY-like chemotaxis protein